VLLVNFHQQRVDGICRVANLLEGFQVDVNHFQRNNLDWMLCVIHENLHRSYKLAVASVVEPIGVKQTRRDTFRYN